MREPTEATALARKLAETSHALPHNATAGRTVQAVADLAPATVPGVEEAAVVLVHRDGRVEVPATTTSLAESGRALELLERGPGVDAALEQRLVQLEDTSGDERWPEFADQADALDLRSALACPLPLDKAPYAGLVLLARKPKALDETAVCIAELYAQHAGIALTHARSTDSLRAAIRSRQLIGEATGILMERHRVDSRAGFESLVQASQKLNVKLHAVAERVIHTGQEPLSLQLTDFHPPL